MAIVVRMPSVMAGATEASLQTWLVAPGDELVVGQPVAEIETEKAVVEYGAEDAGTVAALLVDPGEAIAVGSPILVLAEPGESADEARTAAAADAATTPPSDAAGEPVPDAAASPVPGAAVVPVPDAAASPSGRRFMSPLVRRLARDHDLDLSGVEGSGPGGRIVRVDLDALLEGASPAAGAAPAEVSGQSAPAHADGSYTDVPLTPMRRAIARRLTESATTVPQFEVRADCRVDALLGLRADLAEQTGERVSLNDFVVKAVGAAMREVPEANAIFTGEAIRRFDDVDVAIAVALDDGLIAPVLRRVDRMPLAELAHATRDLADRARSGRLRPAELAGGAISVSNLGMYGSAEFTAIIDPPRSGILAVGAAMPRPVVVDGELGVATVMTVTLSADHRVLDGAVAARWLAAFASLIERPLRLLV